MIRLLVGLCNPGPEYEGTRHNAGQWWLEAAALALGVRLSYERSYHGNVARVNRPNGPNGPVWLLQPLTFMNLSGKAVGPLARFFKIEPSEILVLHDELDLMPGQIKLKQGGGVAGHNGLKDIQAQLGSADFWRLRIGIGHPGVREQVIHWVLQRPTPEHREAIYAAIDQSLTALPLLLDGAMDLALAKIHARPPRPKSAIAPKPATEPEAQP